jgi:hypothetical protein
MNKKEVLVNQNSTLRIHTHAHTSWSKTICGGITSADFKSKGPLVTKSVLFAFSMAPMKSRPTQARSKEGSEDTEPNFSTSNTIVERNLESETGKA